MLLRRALLVTVGLLVIPTGVQAAVPQNGLVYSPRNGAELVQAAKLVSALPETSDGGTEATIQLATADYVVTEPVVISPKRAFKLAGPESGGAVLTNGVGAPVALLRVTGGPHTTRAVVRDLSVELNGASTAAFVAVEAKQGVELVDVDVTVPAATPNVTAVRIGVGGVPPFPIAEPSGMRLDVRSGATGAPAVTLDSAARLEQSQVTGGEPTVRLQRTRTNDWDAGLEASVRASRLTAGTETKRVIEIGTASKSAQKFTVAASELRAGAKTTTLVDVAGPTGAGLWGRPETLLSGITALGGGHAKGLVLHPGAVGSSKPLLLISGLLQLDGAVAVQCANELGAHFDVKLRAVYREGALDDGGDTCTITEEDRRTADPKFRDRANDDLEPLVGSSLIDAAQPFFGGTDVRGNPRKSERSCCTNGAPGEDIGAVEYQYSAPVLDEVWGAEPGNRGLVILEAAGHDESEEEDALYGITYTWTFSDGTVLEGPSVSHRLALPERVKFEDWYPFVNVMVRDASGMTDVRSIALDPWIAECEPATDSPEYERGRLCSGPDDEDAPYDEDTPIVQKPGSGTTQRPSTPRPTTPVATTPQPVVKPAPALVSRFELLRSRASSRSRRTTAIATSQPNDAALRIGLTAPGKLRATVARKSGAAWKTVKSAVVAADLPKGRSVLRITSRFGPAKLRAGVYRVTLELSPAAGGAPVVRTADVRILR